MKQKILDTIYENAYCDYSANTASDEDVNDLVEKSNFEFDVDYLNFLKTINGFELNGMNFYGTKEQEDIYVLDVIKQNKFWTEEIPELKKYFLLGDSDMDFYCYGKNRYFILNKGGLDKCGEFDSFNSFLEYLIDNNI